MHGYIHEGYAESLAEFGTPRRLSGSGGWILERRIPGSDHYDATGCYPLFGCSHWSRLESDLKDLEGRIVSLSLVADPFGEYDSDYLRRCFPHVVIPFKEHFIVDLSRAMKEYVVEHHRRYARKALRSVQVERPGHPIGHLDEWVKLYDSLILKHGIRGIAVFSEKAFTRQLMIPGMVMFRAIHEGATVAMQLWYVQDQIGYYHLGASSGIGYEQHASFGLFWRALEHFAGAGLRWLDLGSGPGVRHRKTDGLSEFKRGWATGTRTAYFCGRILDHSRYAEIARAKGTGSTDFFPAYRANE